MVFPFFVQAETCRESYIQSTLKKASAKEGKALSLADYQAGKKVSPIISYMEEVGSTLCEVNSIKPI